jgi:hypothetical protein
MRQNICGLDSEKLFELETLAIPDLPVIELQVGSGQFRLTTIRITHR